MHENIRNILFYQTLIVASAALIGWLLWPPAVAIAAAYGGGIAIVNSLILSNPARTTAQHDANRVVTAMYVGAVIRFLVTIVGFAVGMGVFKLLPLPQIAVFALAQTAFILAAKR